MKVDAANQVAPVPPLAFSRPCTMNAMAEMYDGDGPFGTSLRGNLRASDSTKLGIC
jgi:hypothetical protein